jgi:chitin-binding protein
VSPTPTSTGTAAGACTATWSVTNSWSTGFQLGFTVASSGPVPTAGWTVSYSWPGSQAISQIWNATQAQSGAAVTIANLSYNGAISAGSSTTFGLLGTGAAPTALPGLKCTAHLPAAVTSSLSR